ncbi:MAG: hypothetical protein KIS61_36600 [Candidatus Eremiobacteraeota bacterium]|nr:hypothetical protein [Candidatus Eremiobacteraeota bacterium]
MKRALILALMLVTVLPCWASPESKLKISQIQIDGVSLGETYGDVVRKLGTPSSMMRLSRTVFQDSFWQASWPNRGLDVGFRGDYGGLRVILVRGKTCSFPTPGLELGSSAAQIDAFADRFHYQDKSAWEGEEVVFDLLWDEPKQTSYWTSLTFGLKEGALSGMEIFESRVDRTRESMSEHPPFVGNFGPSIRLPRPDI